MKKIIIAAAVVVTAGVAATLSNSSSVKAEKTVKATVVYDQSISLGTAD